MTIQYTISEIVTIYQEIDKKSLQFQLATGLRCPSGCGRCCENPTVEASVSELLPLSEAIYAKEQVDVVLSAIEEREKQGNPVCVLYRSEPLTDSGRCSYYAYRPLVCRLFGFSARKNKRGHLEFCACKNIKEKDADAVRKAEALIASYFDIPVYQDMYMQVASVHPGIGFQRLPINLAIKQAIAYLCWKTQENTKIKEAA